MVGGFLVEGAARSTLRWFRKTSVDAERRFEQLSVVSVCMAGGGDYEVVGSECRSQSLV